jgi:hypothetical protein
MKFPLRRFAFSIAVVILASLAPRTTSAQEDPSIDRLLKKLPPPRI